MKAKIKRGNSFRGVLKYVFGLGKHNKPDRAEIVGGNLSGRNPRELAAEFGVSRRQRPEVKNPVWHCSLSLPKGERLNSQKWHQICERHLQNMGMDPNNHMWIAVRHDDNDFDHVHIIASRISLTGALWHGRNDVITAIESTQALEREFGLKLTHGLKHESESPTRALGEAEKRKRTGQDSIKERMQKILNQAIKAKGFEAFIDVCQSCGLELLPNVGSTGRMNGFSFCLEGAVMKASDIGSKYKWIKLAEKTGFNPMRHMPLIEEMAVAAKARKMIVTEPEAILKAVKVAEPERPKRRNRMLDLLFIRMDDGTYAWKKSKAPAFRDFGDHIRFERSPDAAVKAGLQLAREKGWKEVEASGSMDFRRRSWLQGRLIGVKVIGYDPTADDLVVLAELKRETAVRVANKESNSIVRQILILKADSEAELQLHHAMYGEIPSAQIDDKVQLTQFSFAERHADDAYHQAKNRLAASRSALKKFEEAGIFFKLTRTARKAIVQAQAENNKDWTIYLAHCSRIAGKAMSERTRLFMQVANLELQLKDIRAGKILLGSTIDGSRSNVGSNEMVDKTLNLINTKPVDMPIDDLVVDLTYDFKSSI